MRERERAGKDSGKGGGQERDGEFQHKSAHIRGNFERSFDLRSVDI